MALCYPVAVSLNKGHKVTKNGASRGTATTAGASPSTPSSSGHDPRVVWHDQRVSPTVHSPGLHFSVCLLPHRDSKMFLN